MKKYSLIIILNILSFTSIAQKDSLQARLILIGDAGDFKNGKHPVIDAVKLTTPIDEKTTVIFLGDNLYSTGLPDVQSAFYDIRRTVMDTQINIVRGTDAKAIFIPGNHDWDRGGQGGWDAVLREQNYIESRSNQNVQFQPKGGCPGPVEINVSPDVLLVVFDSQWWIHPYDKPGVESDCPHKTKQEFLVQLEDILSKNQKKLVILACHHPFKSYGIHGGYFTLKQHIFPFTDVINNMYLPLPVIGSIYPITRGVFGLPEDLSYPAYENMIKEVSKVAKIHPNLIFISGHEHNLQYIKDSSFHYIVSGSGTKSTRVSNGKHSLYTTQNNGYAVMEISKQKSVDLSFYTVTDSIRKTFTDHVLNFSKLPLIKNEDTIPVVYVPYAADSIVVSANKEYAKASKTKRFFNGDNYREVWAEPVKLKVFRINAEMGGFTIKGIGGGHQTRSLKLADNDGADWSLRSINKDLTKILPPGVKGTLAQRYVQDFISSAHPYSPVIVPDLAKAINITVATPKVMFVPNDPALGNYRPLFANTVCLLEKKEPVPKGIDTKSEQKIINKLYDDNDNRVDQNAFLRARLLDFLLADWDRHLDQWRFAEYDTGKGKLYIPIPRDRDQAFSYSDGFLIKLASSNFIPFIKGFKKDIPAIQWLAYWARDLDRSFLNKLDSAAWKKTIAEFKNNLSDVVIDKAVHNLPPEIFKLSGDKIINKLKSRRDDLANNAAMKYYAFLSRRVDIVGSNKNEYFKVESVGKNLQVRMYKRTGKTDSAALMYSRIFEPAVTKEIDIYGLNGDDFFEIDEKVNTDIKVRIIGGRGDDTFNIKGSVKNYLYDFSGEKNFIANTRRTSTRFENDPLVNRYSQTGFNYNKFSFPNLNVGYNAEDGLLAGIGFSRKVFGFRREPYSSFQKLSTLYAFSSGAYKVAYNGEFNNVSGKKNDIVLTGEIGKPTLNNFFGLGNNSKYQQDSGIQYYRVRYNYATLDAMIRRRLTSYLSVSIGPSVYNYWNHIEDNRNKILSTPTLVGLDSVNVYQTKVYGGGKLQILLNNLNSEILPTRGIHWLTQFSSLGGLNKNSKSFTALTSDMTVYSSLSDPAGLVSILRLGGGHIFNNQYEYFQALNLGQNNFLRGFRKNRFAGKSLAYGSLTLLIKLFDSKSYILPGSVGIIAFDDVGRVWASDQSSNKWHNAVGGGLYFSPFNMFIISAAMGFSDEEKLFNLSLGTKFNLTF